ncbi:MAG: Hsp33 family molecular chaperone HslO [Clostridiales bacterium]|nr:Hsp33 family molecular chaperone HslO [Clostridiales bacterium]MCD7880607.1 Hsp33 family molecular chaperone HslO [Clostridiales bacterium]
MSDKIVRAITSDGAVMASAITARDLVEQARQLHTTLPTATAALGRSLMAASLMGNQLKGEGDSLTLQIRGGGPLGGITCVSDAGGNVRGYVQNPHLHLMEKYQGKLDVGTAVGTDGTLTVIKDLGLKEPYVGSVPLVSGEIAEDVTAYFAVSEQFPTACALGVLVERDQSVAAAGGYLIQLLPGADDETIDRVEAGVRALGNVTPHLQKGMTPEELITAALSGFQVEFLDESPVEYRCNCSRDRYQRALLSLPADDLEEMSREPEGAELKCQFCGKTYRFSQGELRGLLAARRQAERGR